MNKKISFALILAVFIGVFGIYKFSNKDYQGEKIGVILPLSGDVAVYGNSLKKGMNLALDRYNKQHPGAKHIELTYEDSKASPKLAVSAFEKLTSVDKCKLVLGAFSSAEALSIAPIAERTKTVLISPTASSPNLTNAGDYIFRTTPSDNFDGSIMAKFAFENLKLRNMAILFKNNEYGNGITKVFVKEFEHLGGKVAIDKSFESGEKDFKPQLLAIKKENPDGLYIIADGEIGIILKQKNELQLNPLDILTVGLAENPKVIEIAGSSANGVYYSYPSFQVNSKSNIVKTFVSAFEKKYDSKPDVLAAYGFDLMNVTIEALRNNPVSSDEIKDALYSIKSFDGVTGEMSFDKNGDVSKVAGIKVINNGKFEWYLTNFK